MLIRTAVLQRIKSGEITLAFRRWRKPTVKRGSSLRTAIGVLAVGDVRKVTSSAVSTREAEAAGYDNRRTLMAELGSREGDIYRIELAYAGTDPRVALCEHSAWSEAEVADKAHAWTGSTPPLPSGPRRSPCCGSLIVIRTSCPRCSRRRSAASETGSRLT